MDKNPKSTNMVLRLTRLLGVLPFDGNGRFSRGWMIYSLTVHSVVVVTLVACLCRMNSNVWNVAMVDWLVRMMDGTSSLFIVLPHLYKLSTDEYFHAITRRTLEGRWSAKYAVVYPTLAAVSLFLLWVLLLVIKPGLSVRVSNTIMIFVNFVSFLVMNLFCGAVDVVAKRIEKLSAKLGSRPNAAIEEVLCQLKFAENVNTFFSPQLLFMCFKVFLTFTLGMYRSIDSQPANPILSNSSRISIVTYNVCLLFLVTTVCNRCVSVVQAFNFKLFKLMKDSDYLCSNKKLVLHVTMKQTVKFSACGFFPLGNPLITSIIAGATTYLVILMQFT